MVRNTSISPRSRRSATLNPPLRRAAGLALGLAALAAPAASGATIPLQWLNMAPTPFGSTIPNNSNFFLPGVGNVNVTYNINFNIFTQARFQSGLLQNGNVVSGGNTYSWGPQELFGVTNQVPSNPLVGTPWSITFTFPTTLAPNTIYLGVAGLGQTTSFGGGASIAQVSQNGTFLGDWTGGGNFGPTQFTSGAGTFSMQNSLTGSGGFDPWWNTPLGVVQINDPISSLTVNFSQISGDGLGVNIATPVPTPSGAGVLGLGLLAAARRRRR